MSDIQLFSLGGVREDGKNMYVVRVNHSMFILDCGLIYPPDEMLGIDYMIPDFTYIKEHADEVAGVFLSHEHADAIGGLPYLLRELQVPVFGTEFAITLVKQACKKAGLRHFDDFYVIDESNEIEFDDVTVKFFKTTHTVPDSLGIVLETDEGSIVYTGDFKFDMTVSPDYQTDFRQINEISKNGVLALLSESQQAASYFENAPERELQAEIEQQIKRAEGRVIVAAVESNLLRVQQTLDVAQALGRHVFLSGRNGERIIDMAIQHKLLTVPSDDLFQPLNKLDQFADDQVIILETGETGEPLTTLTRMAKGQYGKLKIKHGDLVMIVTTPNAGMEMVLARTKDAIHRAGGYAVDLFTDFHSSGHATPKDLQLMIHLLRPQYLFPVSGEYQQMHAHRKVALAAGVPDERIFLLDRGDVAHYRNGEMKLTAKVPAANTLIDGSGVGDIGNVVLKDRRILSEDGIFVVIATISRAEGKLLAGPKVISRGFVFMKASDDLIEKSKQITTERIEKKLKNPNHFDWGDLKSDIREAVSKYLYKETKRHPMVLPVIEEASTRRRKRNFRRG